MQVTSLDSGTNVDEVDALTLEHVLEKLNITEYRDKFLSEKIDLDTLVSRKRFSEQVLETLHFGGWRFNMISMSVLFRFMSHQMVSYGVLCRLSVI